MKVKCQALEQGLTSDKFCITISCDYFWWWCCGYWSRPGDRGLPTGPQLPCSHPPCWSSQPLRTASSKFLLFPHKPGLPPLSHHLAGSVVKKMDAVSALFMAFIRKSSPSVPRGGPGGLRGREVQPSPGLDGCKDPPPPTRWTLPGSGVGQSQGNLQVLPTDHVRFLLWEKVSMAALLGMGLWEDGPG